MHYVNSIYIDSETNYFMILIMYISPKQHIIKGILYIKKSIQTMYSIGKYTFKLTKPVEIYKVQYYEIVLVSFPWIQIN